VEAAAVVAKAWCIKMSGTNGENIKECPLVKEAIKQIDKVKTLDQAAIYLSRASYVLTYAQSKVDEIMAR
jgi:hypothetical protein